VILSLTLWTPRTVIGPRLLWYDQCHSFFFLGFQIGLCFARFGFLFDSFFFGLIGFE